MPYPAGLPLYTIWDEIAYFLESPKDLLSLALTCRTFKELIIPDHLEYRDIRCDIRRKNALMFLASRPRLARGIRFLEVIREPGDRARLPQALKDIPGPTVDDHDLPATAEDMAAFRNFLSRTVSLKKFSWRQGCTSPEELIATSHVLTNTTRCLEALHIEFYWLRWCHIDEQIQNNKLSIWGLTGLTEVILYHPCAAAVQMILQHCPDIEYLCLWVVPNTAMFQVMQYGEWKGLRSLSIYQNYSPSEEEIDNGNTKTIASFFSRHTNLETLFLHLENIPLPKLPSSCLPNLRSFAWAIIDRDFVLTSFLSVETISRLVHWAGPIDGIDINALPLMANLESCYQSLNYQSIHDPFLPELESFLTFLLKTPNLKKICLDTTYIRKKLWTEWAEESLIKAFLKFPTLTHIFYDFMLPAADRASLRERLELLAKRLCTPLRCLEYLRIGSDEEEQTFVKLERGEDGLYSGYQLVTSKDAGGDSDCWTGLFTMH